MATRPMQNVKFTSVDEFLDYLPANERRIVSALRALILTCAPELREKLSFNVPFYSGYRQLFFIWPPAVHWGSKGPKAVQLGFCNGNLLSDTSGLEKGSRKQVYIKHVRVLQDIDRDNLSSLIYEAVLLDEERRKQAGRK